MSESIIIVALAVSWLWYLGWYWRQRLQAAGDQKDQVNAFSNGLGRLGSTRHTHDLVPRPQNRQSLLVPRGAIQAAQRRRDIGIALAMFCVTTLFTALAFGGVFWFGHLAVDLAAGSFAFFVSQRRSRAAEREMKVHLLYPNYGSEEAALLPFKEVVNG